MNDDLVVTPDEVRAVARSPLRAAIGAAVILALLTGLGLCSAARVASVRYPPPIDLDGCDPARPSAVCLASLAPESRRLPEPEAYRSWRVRDACRWFRDAASASTTADDLRRVEGALPIWDRWAELRLDAWRRGYVPAPGAVRRVLLELREERDWSAVPPAPADPSCDEGTRLAAELVLAPLLPALASDVASIRRNEWEATARASRIAWELTRPRRELAHRATTTYGPLTLLASLLLAVAWLRLPPVPIVAGLHRLRIGRRTFEWSRVQDADWHAYPPVLRVDGRALGIGPLRTLSAPARRALTEATARARQRAASLGELDRAALDAVRELGR